MIENPITSQVHKIDTWWKISTITLGELFEGFWENVRQIVRLKPQIYATAVWKTELHLFNTPDVVNKELLQSFEQGEESQALLAKIYWPEGIIDESSLQVRDVLEMQNIDRWKIAMRELYRNSIPGSKNDEELYTWLQNEFYSWMDLSEHEQFLFRILKK